MLQMKQASKGVLMQNMLSGLCSMVEERFAGIAELDSIAISVGIGILLCMVNVLDG